MPLPLQGRGQVRALARWPELWFVAAMAVVWAVFTGQLAVLRHMNLQTNAFDLGYVSQALWYDAHGEPFRFTTAQGVNAVLEGVDLSAIRHPHWLLAFHVEPALLLLAPLYSLWPDARLLLWLQAAVVSAGALPAALLAQRLLGGRLAPLAFGVAWLLAPGLEGAILSDFHMVALGATLLMCGLWLLESGRRRWAVVLFALTALTREDAAVAVAWLGVVLMIRDRRWPAVPALLVGGGGLWAATSLGLIEPFFSGGVSAFGARYAWLLLDPTAIVAWFGSGEVVAYLTLQLLAGGIIAVVAPLELAAALPLLAVNALSMFDWMRSGGGHYSALLVPLLLWAGAHGARRLKARFGGAGARVGYAGVTLSAVAAQVWVGASPLHAGFTWPSADARAAHAVQAASAIPPDASMSATSGLYPHLSARHDAYWFPSTGGAGWLALDVAGSTHPLSPAAMHDAALIQLGRPDMELQEARDGALVIRRRTPAERDALLSDDPAERTLGAVLRRHPEALPPEFYGFALAQNAFKPIGPVRFGQSLELVAYSLERWPEVGLLGSSVKLVTYWRAREAMSQELRFALASSRTGDGALAGVTEDAAAAALWYPTTLWPPGRTIRLEMNLGQPRGIQAVGVAVKDTSGRRLPATGDVDLWDGATIAAVARVS
jgi:uncharacterized membrane protein